ncbi:hypothetical protein ABL78_8047 [Leptomonas seymouri]|uniref:Uncharacterized protein n=1 Tax=Leptomonas seymouri TaxID=5684 RepID=A0A0N0P2G9_LEPSE|nr:hypothetical protein ABL78_8047 [Leptomonas seymouri]|eukprot:KPI82939.1 hypothetical protein ABL78_8047 [Leptomonas seymouri]
MSADTNLHRTFDYQLSQAPLRIIDWAPVKSLAASVLQGGPNAKSYSVVDRTSSNEAAAAAAFLLQENAKREASKAQLSNNKVNGVGGAPPSSWITAVGDVAAPSAERHLSESPVFSAAAAAPHRSAAALASLAAGQTDASVIAAASPYYTPGAAVNAPGEAMEVRAAEDPLQQWQYADNWAGGSTDVASASPSAVLLPPSGAAFKPAATVTASTGAAKTLMAADGTTFPSAAAAATGSTLTGNGNGISATHTSGHSSAATPKAGAGVRVRTPPSPAPSLARYHHQWGAASTMFGYDKVYRNGSFGVLLGLFTGVGYQQTNIFYRQQERAGEGVKGRSAFPVATAGETTGGSNLGSVPNSVNNRSASEGNTTSSAAVATADGSTGIGISDVSNRHEAVAGVPDSSHEQHVRMGPVIAYKCRGDFQLTNIVQCLWYWGARKWTGVLNLRLTPLLSGDAMLPVCECVARTEITETSILVDDPVVYIHSFVLMLGRRKQTPDNVPSLSESCAEAITDPVASVARQADTPHPLAVAAASQVSSGKSPDHQTVQRKNSESKSTVRGKHTESRVGAEASRSPEIFQSAGMTALAPADDRTTASLSSSQQHHHGADAHSTVATTQAVASHEGPTAASSPDKSTKARTISAADEPQTPDWFYSYQRCMMATSEEWLWNRTASEVAADIAQSATPWWKLRHVKTGVGLSYRYRKPRGINVYWGWSAQLGRGTSLSGHVDVLRRMSCSVSSSFGYLDLSVRLRVNLVTLHQTALDAGLRWQPLPHIPELAVRVATSANGTTLGLEFADVAPRMYGPVVRRLAERRLQKQQATCQTSAGEREMGALVGTSGSASNERSKSSSSGEQLASSELQNDADGNREDLVGLLPVTWHYLRGFGSTITHAYSGVAGTIANTWNSKSATNTLQAKATVAKAHRAATPLPVLPPPPSLPAESTLSGMVLPLGRASLRYFRNKCSQLADPHWLEEMLRTSHVNVSVGITAEPGKLTRDWSLFFIVSEK